MSALSEYMLVRLVEVFQGSAIFVSIVVVQWFVVNLFLKKSCNYD